MKIEQRSFVMFLLLSFVTCGIYSIYFWYKYVEDVNTICKEDGEETTNYIVAILLGIVTCGIYLLFWYYKLGNRLQNNGTRYNVTIQENGTSILLWMILGSFIGVGPIIVSYFMIKNVNLLADEYNKKQ